MSRHLALDRVTNGSGLIRDRHWNGEGGMAQLRTVKEPRQALATFAETIALLMKVRNLLRVSECSSDFLSATISQRTAM